MDITKDEISKQFRRELSVIRGKIYTWNLKQNNPDYSTKDWFYLTTVAPEDRVNPFDGVITEGVNHATEVIRASDMQPVVLENLSGSDTTLTPFIYWTPHPFPGTWSLVRSQWGLEYDMDGFFKIDSSQSANRALRYTYEPIAGGYYYKWRIRIDGYGGGKLWLNEGHRSGEKISANGLYEGIFDTTYAEPGSPQYLQIVYDKDFLGKISEISLKRVGACDETMIFTPSFLHPDTIYYESSKTPGMGGKINILNERGPIENGEERYYTLGINQTNRTYAPTMKSDPKIVSKYLRDGLPGGLFKNVYNLPPTGTVASDRPANQYYDAVNNDKTVSLSGLISDPENDTLNYRWTHFAPKKSLDGVSLLTTFDDPQSLDTTATLVTPPTDMIYTLHLEVADSDNITTIPINIKVSGTVEFENWAIGSGINTFDLGDSNVPFDDLD